EIRSADVDGGSRVAPEGDRRSRGGGALSAARWDRLEEIFDAAGAVPEAARAAFLDGACADDPLLRSEIEAMLAASEAKMSLSIERLVVESPPGPVDSWIGRTVGPWRLTRAMGRGGMGLVYGAVRADGHYRQEVALKLMRAGPRDPHAGERFRTERQVLASLRHP